MRCSWAVDLDLQYARSVSKLFSVGVQKTVVTSSLALARTLWRLGEPALAQEALALEPDVVLDIGTRAAELNTSGLAEQIWPDGPRYRAVVLATIERLEGAPRACRRDAPRDDELPPEYQASQQQEQQAMDAVRAVSDARRAAGHPVP